MGRLIDVRSGVINFICSFTITCCYVSASSIYVHTRHWMKLARNFKDFPALTASFKDFQGLEFLL